MPELLKIQKLQIGLITAAKNILPIIGNVNFQIQSGETYALLGESGSGKTLTSLAIMQLLPSAICIMEESKIILNNVDLLNLSEFEMHKIRGRRIAMIFQEPATSLNPTLTIGEQISEVLIRHFQLKNKTKKDRILDLFYRVGLS